MRVVVTHPRSSLVTREYAWSTVADRRMRWPHCALVWCRVVRENQNMCDLRVVFFYPLPLGLQQPQAVPWAQVYVVYMYGSETANGTGANLNGHC